MLPAALLLAGFLAPFLPAAASPPGAFATNGLAKPLSTLQHPAGEYFEGITYVAYQGPHEDPYVCAYDHASGRWQGPVQAGVSLLSREPDPTDPDEVDNHGRPALIVDRAGYIHLFFGGHGGVPEFGPNTHGTPGRGRQTHVVSERPRDISSWRVLDNVSPYGTYSQVIKKPDGALYLFYRHGSHRSDWVYQKSQDNGLSFSPPVTILQHKAGAGDPNTHDAWYAWFEETPDGAVHVVYNAHPCANPGHSSARFHIYFMRMNADDTWQTASGEPISLPVTREYADRHTRTFASTGGGTTRLGLCRTDPAGRPHLLFRQAPGNGTFVHQVWTGHDWQTSVDILPGQGAQDADLAFPPSGALQLVFTRRLAGKGEILSWESLDGGLSFRPHSNWFSLPGAELLMSSFVRSPHPDARLTAAALPADAPDLYRPLFLLGPSGPLP